MNKQQSEFRVYEMRASITGSENPVERDEQGVPTAFRIWRAGVNVTDYGENVFSEESAALLLDEQERRGNRYSFDINHLSLDKAAPLENQRAVGSFTIEVRGGDLWAVDCRWTPATRVQLMAGEWLSISPAYDVRTSDGVIVSLMNCALTGTPATHNATQLAATRIAASRGGSARMTTGGGASSIPTDVLRVVASCRDRDLATKAKRELARRGEPQTDPNTRDGARLAAMLVPYSQPTVVHDGHRSEFPVMSQEQARVHLAKTKR
jgi:hypothetical protein